MTARRMSASMRGMLSISLLGIAAACEREERRFAGVATSAPAMAAVSQDTLQPGVPAPDVDIDNPSERNAYDLAEGKRLFESWNCSGCHSHGGGGMGPPLMDSEWIYGSDPENIVATIVEGRPNGMPSFRGRITDQQLWRLTGYVRALAGLAPKAAKPGRDDDMQYKRDEQRTPPQPPRSSATKTRPAKSERP